jgi:tRNA (guanine26-N2/guanine27-N2)-dimethyltransferase
MSSDRPSDQHQEGQAKFAIGSAFYRAKSKIARDLALLAAALHRQRLGHLRVMDAMSGCGVRALRYCLEANATQVWVNEANPDLAPLIQQNLAGLPAAQVKLTQRDAREVCFTCYQNRDFYDLVDLDNFGSPSTYIEAGLWATSKGGLCYITSTDGRSTGGHDPEGSLKHYGAYARAHPAVHEQGLRLLIGQAAQVAASRGMGIEPVFSLFTGQVHRAMVRLVGKPTLTSRVYGFLAYCHRCKEFQTVNWRQLGRAPCPGCSPPDVSCSVVSGPFWLGALHGVESITAMRNLAQQWGWSRQANLLTVMKQEANLPPYYYPLGAIGRAGGMDIPNRDRLIQTLRDHGYRASATHIDWQAVKTDASFRDCVAMAKRCHSH